MELKEKAKGQAERTRQMYVAATRAQDHLVVSLFGTKRGRGASFAGLLEEKVGRDSNLWSEITLDEIGSSSTTSIGVSQEPTPDSKLLREKWLVQRLENIKTSSKPSSIGATGLAQLAKDEAEGGDVPYRKGRGGTNIGRAVHSALQSVDLATGEGIDAISQAQAAAEGLPNRWKEVEDLARTALESEIVKQAVSTGAYHREVYVGAPEGTLLLEGFIDLVFEVDEGLIIVDYKTDGVETPEEIARSMDRYRLQGASYALALEGAAGKPVAKVVFLFLHTGSEVVMEDLSGSMQEVKGAVAQLVS